MDVYPEATFGGMVADILLDLQGYLFALGSF